MPTGTAGQGCGTPQGNWTFGQWKNWANCKSPGAGNKFWAWVQAQDVGPYAPPKLSDTHYAGGSFASVLQGNNNSAGGWFGAWLLHLAGSTIAQDLATAIGKGGQDTVQAAAGAVQGLSFHDSILAFLGDLTNPHLWIRILEVLAGIVMLAVGVARITNAVPLATKIARTAAKGAVLA